VRRGRISVFRDVFNAYDRDNPQAFEYNVGFNPNNGRLSVERNFQTLLPRLPTIGATWEF
jgi:hypothetical protein